MVIVRYIVHSVEIRPLLCLREASDQYHFVGYVYFSTNNLHIRVDVSAFYMGGGNYRLALKLFFLSSKRKFGVIPEIISAKILIQRSWHDSTHSQNYFNKTLKQVLHEILEPRNISAIRYSELELVCEC